MAPAALSLGSYASISGLVSTNRTSLLSPDMPRSRKVTVGNQLSWPKMSCSPSALTHTGCRAVTAESEQAAVPEQSEKEAPTTYHFLVANAKFLLDEEEHFREQLDERLRHLGERGREQNFWLVPEPKFLDAFPDITRRLNRPAVALVSTDAHWMRFMKLRLDRVLADSFEAATLQEALDAYPVHLKFPEPASWTAPYPKYEYGWWEPFLPPKA